MSITGSNNFCIEKSDASGFITGPGSFNMDYRILESNPSCTGSPSNQALTCGGISVIETTISNGTLSASYAACGTYSNGVFFFTLNSAGTPIMKALYMFPTPTTAVKKSYIIESPQLSNNYFICGSIDTVIYAMKINSSGTVMWSSFYNSGSIEARGIAECPYTNDLIIFGNTSPPLSYTKTIDGFMLRLDKTNGNIVNYKTYGDVGCQGFSSLSVSNSTLGGTGFIMGGDSDPLLNAGRSWFVKLDQSGNVIWNTITQPSLGAGAFPVMSIFEKQNGASYDYYALTSEWPNGMIVLKMSETGNPSSGVNEFVYKTNNSTYPVSMTFTNSGTLPGIRVFGIDNISSPSAFYEVSANFNGQSGCTETLTTIAQTETIVASVTSPWIIQSGSLIPCFNFDIKETAVTSVTNTACIVTGIDEKLNQNDVAVYPNPAHETCFITFLNEQKNISVDITDIQNRTLYNLYNGPSKENLEINLYNYSLADGFYFLKIGDENQVVIYKKIILNKR
ncbi:MAG: hypothetical protein K0S32_688 [Bacteroidetes bacterium]|nr:hypothetical protein [Bacteroidota bacterium]